MNQDILDAINNLAVETEKLRREVKILSNINSELKTEVYELKEKLNESQD